MHIRADGEIDALAHRRTWGFCGRAFALVKPPDEHEVSVDSNDTRSAAETLLGIVRFVPC
jgi:hypothetical protein